MMTPDSLLTALRDTDVMLPLLGSLVSGALIGLEREMKGKPAGLRTHTLVCFASALMTLLGLRMAEWTIALPEGTQIVSDMARMPHAILTGVGFLGAGVIFREGATVQGLTTAASLWLTAVLGIVLGTGLVDLAMIGTMITLIVLVLLRLFERLMPPRLEIRLEMAVAVDSPYDGARLTSDLVAEGLSVGTMSIRQEKATGVRRYMLLASGPAKRTDCEQVLRRLQKAEGQQDVAITALAHNSG